MTEETKTSIETEGPAGKKAGDSAPGSFNAKKAIIAGSVFLAMLGVLFGISMLKAARAAKKPNADEAQIEAREAQKKGELKAKVANLAQAPIGQDSAFDEQGNYVGPMVPSVELPENKKASAYPGTQRAQEDEIGQMALSGKTSPAPYSPYSGSYQPSSSGSYSKGQEGDPGVMRETRAASKEERDLLAASMLGYSRRAAQGLQGAPGTPKAGDGTRTPTAEEIAALAGANLAGAGREPHGAEAEYIKPMPGGGRSFTVPGELADMRVHGGAHAKVPEGKSLECVTVNQVLAQAYQAPVILTVSRDFRTADGRLLIPAGARIIGMSDRIQDMNQDRMFLAFNRLDFPDGETAWFPQHRLPEALDTIGSLGVEGKVKRGIMKALMSSIALGVVEGLGAAAAGPQTISTTTGIMEVKPGQQAVARVSDQLGKFSDRVLSRYMNMIPKITLKPGTRVRVYLSEDTLMSLYPEAS